MTLTYPPIDADAYEELVNSTRFAENVLAEYVSWRLYLHTDQCYLGRAYLWYSGSLKKHKDNHDFSDLNFVERTEMQSVLERYRRALNALWQPDLVNYCWLGNEVSLHRGHGHLHIVPRYAAPRAFGGVEFLDKNWGKNYTPHPKPEYPRELILSIRNALKKKLG